MAHQLFLIRHEDATDDRPDAYRALTAEGRIRAHRTARFLATQGVAAQTLISSPLVRAVQTAEIFASALGIDNVEIDRTIAEPPSVEAVVELLVRRSDGLGLIVVGHEPTLSGLARELLPELGFAGFSRGSVLAASFDPRNKRAQFRFQILPDGPHLVDRI